MIKNIYTRKKSSKKFARGKRARAVCDRSGFEHALKDMVVEPGTGLLVYKRWSDGRWNRVHHPQNFSADTSEAVGLKNARTDEKDAEPSFLKTDEGELILGDKGLPIFVY